MSLKERPDGRRGTTRRPRETGRLTESERIRAADPRRLVRRMAEEGKERARRAPQKDRRSCPAATGRNQGGCENPPYSYWILVSTRSAAALVSTAGYRNNAQ